MEQDFIIVNQIWLLSILEEHKIDGIELLYHFHIREAKMFDRLLIIRIHYLSDFTEAYFVKLESRI